MCVAVACVVVACARAGILVRLVESESSAVGFGLLVDSGYWYCRLGLLLNLMIQIRNLKLVKTTTTDTAKSLDIVD